jgi:hypothetical protein
MPFARAPPSKFLASSLKPCSDLLPNEILRDVAFPLRFAPAMEDLNSTGLLSFVTQDVGRLRLNNVTDQSKHSS